MEISHRKSIQSPQISPNLPESPQISPIFQNPRLIFNLSLCKKTL
jgi:hypothetical protein